MFLVQFHPTISGLHLGYEIVSGSTDRMCAIQSLVVTTKELIVPIYKERPK